MSLKDITAFTFPSTISDIISDSQSTTISFNSNIKKQMLENNSVSLNIKESVDFIKINTSEMNGLCEETKLTSNNTSCLSGITNSCSSLSYILEDEVCLSNKRNNIISSSCISDKNSKHRNNSCVFQKSAKPINNDLKDLKDLNGEVVLNQFLRCFSLKKRKTFVITKLKLKKLVKLIKLIKAMTIRLSQNRCLSPIKMTWISVI